MKTTTMEKPFPNTPESRKRFFTFIYLAMVLALITGVEIVLIWMPLASWLIYTALGILSIIKFLAVIWWFMHMRWDRALIAVIFFVGLAIGGGTGVVLWSLFAYDDYAPAFEDFDQGSLSAEPTFVEQV